ncbi:EAL domain-containing protein [Luteimonas fraxinea]|uniref:EAL domain-containing protein n=1 Tax=Luteimonas fraxinea TaxID=2901869 RepID=UPI001E4B8834|nr:EAL domain-containing protein [Luteimonas fraxinea]UHH11319.1 EAL domain-containing protein [Luteimonas fraxinea]
MQDGGASEQDRSNVARARRRRNRALLIGGLLVASVCAAALVVAWNDLRVRQDAGERYVRDMSAGLARNLELTLGNLDRAFTGIGADLDAIRQRGPDASGALVDATVQGVLSRHPDLQDLALVDARPDFATPEGPDGTRLQAGDPLPAVDGKGWVLPLALAVSDAPDGSPRWLLGHLRVTSLHALLRELDLGRSGTATFVHRNGQIVTRSDPDDAYVGTDVGESMLFTQGVNLHEAGLLEGRSDLDGTRRLIGFHALSRYPLIATVGVGRDDLLAGWWTFVAALATGAGLLLLTWLFGLRMLVVGARRERALSADIARSAGAITDLTARMRDVEAQYRYLYERHPLPSLVYDRDTLQLLAVNEAAIAEYGYALERFLELTADAIVVDMDGDAVRREVARDPAPHIGRRFRHRRRDGSTFAVTVYSSSLQFLGRPARLVLVLDTSDRERVEAERERSEARFQMVARATSDAIWDWDIATGRLWWNEGFTAQYGWDWRTHAATIDQWSALLHPDDEARVGRDLDAALSTGATEWHAQYRLRCENGDYAYVEDRGTILRDADGQPVRAVGGMLDVTRRLRDESDLRLLRRAVEATENGIIIADACADDQPIVYVNPAFSRITGYAAEDSIGRNCRFLQGDERDQPALPAIREAIEQAREVRVQLRNYRRDGSPFWNELRMAPVRDQDGALTHFVGILNDITERRRAEDALAHRATHDELTGLPNRELVMACLAKAVARADAGDSCVGLVFVDLDDFKLINDSLGHASGDEVLRTVGRRLRATLQPGDTVGRFGGDEFVLVVNAADRDAVARATERVFAALSQPMEIGAASLQITPSIGYCRHPGDGDDPALLLRHADQAMYQAKQQGRNCVVAYRDEFGTQASERLALVSQLRDALQTDQFALAFQLQFDQQRRPVGMEALLRWQHPERGLLTPDAFIAVCEDSGLIVPIGRWVLREAARHHRILVAHGWGHLRLAVNVSAAQFQQGLVDDVLSVLRDFQLPAGILELELTESVVMASPDNVIRDMATLRDAGVCIAIDDFGTGYSSLAYLKRLPLHRVKLDRSFVQDLGRDPDDEAICDAIIRMAQRLGLCTTAEGVETDLQWNWLAAHGCEELQGYLFARPVPFEDALALLNRPGGA